MNKRIFVFILIQISVILIGFSLSYAWNGEPLPFKTMSREDILRIASEMTNFSWSPMNVITNWNYTNSSGISIYYSYTPGLIYDGEAYTQNNPQQNWAEFYSAVNDSNIKGYTKIGNDCSGFVSICWKLPGRYTTWDFENDAVADGGYVNKLGDIGTAKNASLLPGDALVKRTASDGHIILFKSYLPDGSGISAIEQTPDRALSYSTWSWNRLASYRPIRRKNIDERYNFVTQWGSSSSPGSGYSQFYYPRGVAVDYSGNVYVADSGNHRIKRFDTNGTLLLPIWGAYGEYEKEFNEPHSIAFDSSDNMYVADTNNHRIQKFTSNFDYITQWYGNSSPGGLFIHPNGVAVDYSGNVYVADTGKNRIQKFNSNGTSLLAIWGSLGSKTSPPQFTSPFGIAVDASKNVYVADTGNNRIMKFNENGTLLQPPWGSFGHGYGLFFTPIGITAGPYVYVADTYNHLIQKFDYDGSFLGQMGGLGTEVGKSKYPEGVAADRFGNVYIADTGNHRVLKYKSISPQPTRPSNLSAALASRNRINLSWTDNSNNETVFKIMRKIGINGQYAQIATVGANAVSYSDTNIPGSSTYYYAVWAYNSEGNSAYSNEASATIIPLPPVPDIKANGSDGPLYVSMGQLVNITISLDPGEYSGVNADWGGAKYVSSEGILYWYNFSTGQWTPLPIPGYQGPLFNLSPTSLMNILLAPDTYIFYFGVDLNMNGLLDNPFYYDSVDVIVY